jgi:hypothetical protein
MRARAAEEERGLPLGTILQPGFKQRIDIPTKGEIKISVLNPDGSAYLFSGQRSAEGLAPFSMEQPSDVFDPSAAAPKADGGRLNRFKSSKLVAVLGAWLTVGPADYARHPQSGEWLLENPASRAIQRWAAPRVNLPESRLKLESRRILYGPTFVNERGIRVRRFAYEGRNWWTIHRLHGVVTVSGEQENGFGPVVGERSGAFQWHFDSDPGRLALNF